MTQQHGRRYEHTLCTSLDEITPDEVWVTTAGYSGNSEADACDLVITTDPKYATRNDPVQINIEAKKRQGKSGNRVIIASGSSKGDSGVDEILGLIEGTPDWADPIVAIKFDRRKLIVLDARHLLAAVGELKYPIPDSVRLFDVRSTDSGSLSMRKPTLENWTSATSAPKDSVVLASKLGLPIEKNNE